MEKGNHIWARLCNESALVITDGRSFEVARRDRTTVQAGCPMQMLAGALGACIVLTLDAVAKNKGIDLPDLKVRLDYHSNSNGETRFDVELDLDGALTDRESKILFQSARLCEVSKVLSGDVQIDYHLQQTEVTAE